MDNSIPYFLQKDLPAAKCPENFDKVNWFNSLDYKIQLVTESGNDRFNILYYGDLFDGSIVDTASAPALIIAKDIKTNEEILLFDGARHGHEALFGSTWEEDEILNRRPENIYRDKQNQTIFKVIVWANYNIDYDDERDVYVLPDDPSSVELINGETVPFELVKKIGFDAFGILVVSDSEEVSVAAEMELA
jgi:hypothetical protein